MIDNPMFVFAIDATRFTETPKSHNSVIPCCAEHNIFVGLTSRCIILWTSFNSFNPPPHYRVCNVYQLWFIDTSNLRVL